MSVKNLYHEQQTQLGQKQAAADAYVTIMKHIVDGHQKLFDQRNKFTVSSWNSVL